MTLRTAWTAVIMLVYTYKCTWKSCVGT